MRGRVEAERVARVDDLVVGTRYDVRLAGGKLAQSVPCHHMSMYSRVRLTFMLNDQYTRLKTTPSLALTVA